MAKFALEGEIHHKNDKINLHVDVLIFSILLIARRWICQLLVIQKRKPKRNLKQP